MICWSIEARKIPKNSGSRLIEASLVHGFTSEPEKKKYNYTLDKATEIIRLHARKTEGPREYSRYMSSSVTKTIGNSTTYSEKPGDNNGTFIFEFDIMKNSSPLNLKFTFFATVKTKITLLFCWTHSTLSSASE